MSPASENISPSGARLSWEAADQAILDALAAACPSANVAHAFASTETGVGFDVCDGRAGFPTCMIGDSVGPAELRFAGDSLRIRPTRTGTRYPGSPATFAVIRAEILEGCGRMLPAHNIPTTPREVASLGVTSSGKLAGSYA